MIGIEQTINNLSIFDKFKVWAHYNATMLGLKHNYEAIDKLAVLGNKKDKLNWQHGRGAPDKTIGNIAIYNLWKSLPILTMDEFISPSNIVTRDHGEGWQKNGWAQRIQVTYFGIYNWYDKFKAEIF